MVRVDADAIGRHCEVRAAHGSSIQAMVMTEQGIYTVSQDSSWIMCVCVCLKGIGVCCFF